MFHDIIDIDVGPFHDDHEGSSRSSRQLLSDRHLQLRELQHSSEVVTHVSQRKTGMAPW